MEKDVIENSHLIILVLSFVSGYFIGKNGEKVLTNKEKQSIMRDNLLKDGWVERQTRQTDGSIIFFKGTQVLILETSGNVIIYNGVNYA